ncbi:ribosome biogenesis protein Nop53/GLTSCR2 [Scenedesmus sp. NREL 46B-D3]|nr:ribosome biogenesis protein Nop53/GLTSCR2 [Scenedesmus sp. NREL 46B-D3]
MGGPKTKTSRKGKKAWRKNIDASEVETFLQDEGHKQQREPAVETLKDEELFVLDKAADDSAVPAAVRKQQRREPKPLRSQLILDGLRDGITPVQHGTRKAKEAGRPLPNSTAAAAAVAPAATAQPRKRRRRQQQVPVADLWADEAAAAANDADWTSHTSGNELLRVAQLSKQQQEQAAKRSSSSSSKRKRPAPALIAAVEVDMPGCSFNPEYEAHQDALAVAVAREYKQQLKQELAPKGPSLFAPAGYKPGDELEELLADAEADDDEQQQQQQQQPQLALPATAAAAAADQNEIAIDAVDDDAGDAAVAGDAAEAAGVGKPLGKAAAAAASRAGDKKSRRDRNKEARKKQQEIEADAKRQLKRQRQQLEALPLLQQQLQQQDEEQRKQQERRQVVKQEKAAIQPPRLGKHKFEAAAPEVLTSDQVTGSLRQLQPCFLVTEDRFKALQKRGLIEPRKRAGQKQGRKVEFVQGERREKAEELQQELVGWGKKGKQAKEKKGQQQQQQQQHGGQTRAAPVVAPELGLVMPLAVGGDDGGW